jgi:hypothetical protein
MKSIKINTRYTDENLSLIEQKIQCHQVKTRKN